MISADTDASPAVFQQLFYSWLSFMQVSGQPQYQAFKNVEVSAAATEMFSISNTEL